MSQLRLEFDERKSAARIRELQHYYTKNVLQGNRFICPSFRECKTSLGSGLNFYHGQLSHVGKRYDLKKNSKDLRIVVSGIEYGGSPAKVDMARRYNIIAKESGVQSEFYVNHKTDRGQRNPHMRGTTLIMKRVLLGEDAINNNSYSSWEDEFIERPRIAKNHIFNMFALVNFLLCSAVKDSTQGRSTTPMWRNCSTHYFETLKILDPNLLILQTKGRFGQVLGYLGVLDCWNRKTETLGQFSGHGLNFITCEFKHPSYPTHDGAWSNPSRPYFRQVVNPTLRQALELLGAG